jgi:murein DD-endopeptidase MepM/ murein hydrolase activator NlpD
MLGFWTQAAAIALSLAALGRVGIWTFPPWWTLWLLYGLLAGAMVSGLSGKRQVTRWPSGVIGWVIVAGFGVLGLYAANVLRNAVAASVIPDGPVIDLASPLGPGTYLVANGGAVPSINAHAAFLDRSSPSHRRYWGTGRGVDIVALDRWGLHASGPLPADPAAYVIFGRPVVAPCAGEIVIAVDGLPDMSVPEVDHAHLAGNHVMIRCNGVHILLGHFRRGTVRVRVGDRLNAGAPIAQVGNSGNTSEPHLHIHAQRPGTIGAPFSGAPLPIRIAGRYLVRNDRFMVPAPAPRVLPARS